VIVMCKTPSGLVLDLGDSDARKVRLNGANHPDAVDGAGLTVVDKSFWDTWHTQFKGYPPLETGLIWAADKEDAAKDAAKELKDEKTGFEGLNPEKPGPEVEPTDEQKKELAKNPGKH
jgi:hypothetical protein